MGTKKWQDKVRESFQESAPKAPRDLWSGLEYSLDAQEDALDQKVKESFEDENFRAPETVWQGINRQLTIDKAWQGLNRYLNRRLYFYWFGRAAALILLLFGLYGLFNLSQQNSREANYIKVDLRHLDEAQGQSPTYPSELKPPSQASAQAQDEAENNSGSHSAIGSLLPPRLQELEFALQDTLSRAAIALIDTLPQEPFKPLASALKPGELKELYADYRPINWTKPKLRRRRWAIGFEYSFNRDVISNNISRESKDPRSLVQSRAVYSNNYKLVLHYHMRPQWSLKFGFMPRRVFSQDFSTFREGQFVEDQLNLQYQRLGLGIEHHKPFGPLRGPWALNLGLEAYYANLHRAFNGRGDVSAQYANAWGLQLHLGPEWQHQQFIMGLGLQTDFNVNNLFQGSSKIPAAFDRTLYRSWSLYLSGRYQF